MVLGFDCQIAEIAEATTRKAFEKGLIIERCGPNDQVVKFLPALTIDLETLNQGIDIFEVSLAETMKQTGGRMIGRPWSSRRDYAGHSEKGADISQFSARSLAHS